MDTTARIDLFWLTLGPGGRSVRLHGIVFEALCAQTQAPSAVRPVSLGAEDRETTAGQRCLRRIT